MNKKPLQSQSDRFKEAAREVEADLSDDVLDRIMRKLDLTKKPDDIHASDCSSHNAPAYQSEPCDCGVSDGRR